MAQTYAVLDVTPETFREIQLKLEAAGYQHAFKEDAAGELVIDMHGVALRDETGEVDTGDAISDLTRPGTPKTPGRPS